MTFTLDTEEFDMVWDGLCMLMNHYRSDTVAIAALLEKLDAQENNQQGAIE